MEKSALRIVYMGTPEFAVEPLYRLMRRGYTIAGVVTMPDKPAGRGHKIRFSPVKEYALAHNLPLLQPERLKEKSFLAALRSWKADLQIVVAFRMLPEVVWNMPRLGTFNLHASLLPQYRGAAPINWAVINGEEETGVTTFFLTHEIDTGAIIRQMNTPIRMRENAGEVHDRLKEMGSWLVVETVEDIRNNRVRLLPQEQVVTDELRPAPKIFREDCRIDWNQPVEVIHNFIRGLSPHPVAWSEWITPRRETVTVKIFESEKIAGGAVCPAGQIRTDGKSYIRVATADGWIGLKELQLPGKRRLRVDELLRGYPLTDEYSMKQL
jgi:methionyl-tRNA formyltransferase